MCSFGMIFEAENMKKLIESNINLFYSDKKKINNGINYAKSFSYERHIKQYFAIYENILNEKRKRRF
jgi:hypothetical protein